MADKLDRFLRLKECLSGRPDVLSIQLDEDFITPDKQAGFIPYDCVVELSDPIYPIWDSWTEETVQCLLIAHQLPFDEVVGIDENGLVFVSLVSR